MPIELGTVSIFTPFNFVVLLSSRNKGHANIKGFAVYQAAGAGFWQSDYSHSPLTVRREFGCIQRYLWNFVPNGELSRFFSFFATAHQPSQVFSN